MVALSSSYMFRLLSDCQEGESEVSVIVPDLTVSQVTAVTNWMGLLQGCQMAFFQTQNPNLCKFWRVLQWKMLVYFTASWSILWPFGIYFMVVWYIFPFWYVVPRKIWHP
jgi:hypothetical protein